MFLRDKILLINACFLSLRGIKNTDKLKAIAKVCRALEIFHIFPDGNQRTIIFGLLNKFLIENEFSPVILKDPIIFDGYDCLDELVEEIKQGMERFRMLCYL